MEQRFYTGVHFSRSVQIPHLYNFTTAINKGITLEETQSALQDLKPRKAACMGKVFTDLLLTANEEYIEAIHNLFLNSFNTGTLPSDWKTAEVKFLGKSGKKNYNSIQDTDYS